MSSTKETLFIISPIGNENSSERELANKLYEAIIKPVADNCGYHALRADHLIHAGEIPEQIYKELIESPMVIAVLTNSNPNVFYELAVRHLLKKPVVQICSKQYMEEIPFDVQHVKVLPYPDLDDPNSIKPYRKELAKHIREVRKNPNKSNTLLRIVYEQYASQGFQDQVELFSRSESTKPLGGLTEYYPKVITLIREAKTSVEVLCDYPAYACITHPQFFRKYYDILSRKIRHTKVSISLTCPDEKHRSQNDRDYFAQAFRNWPQWKRNNRVKLDKLSKETSNLVEIRNIDNLTKENFLKMLKKLDQAVLTLLREEEYSKVVFTEISARNPIDFWIIDDRCAVFAFSSYAKGMSSTSFYTEERTFITALRYMRDNYHSRTI
jgi:hypothetical protein